MDELKALFLGVVQGLTEFLPVSSSGHLVVAQNVLGVSNDGLAFEVTVHLATLVSVLIYYRQRVAALSVGLLRRDPPTLVFVGKLTVATLPAVGLVLLAGDFIEAQFESPWVTGVGFLATGCVVWTTRWTVPRASLGNVGWGPAFAIGCAQALAILPGISRSGITVATALAFGIKPRAAAEFSFLMSVIAIAGAGVRSIPELRALPPGSGAFFLLGGLAALLSGVLAIGLFVRMLNGGALYRYAYYTWGLGLTFLAWLVLRGG
ncbi:undecaprenyl-diphosphate phosphatase [Myxococcota bacterium]|nr:undecaprenyl-diphosphate phosphatase [Myxococcota bacterium]